MQMGLFSLSRCPGDVSSRNAKGGLGTGRISIVDADTGNSIASKMVIAWAMAFQKRRLVRTVASLAMTSHAGEFAFTMLWPGAYPLQLAPRVRGRERVLEEFSRTETERVDFDYEPAYWPGGLDLASAQPVSIASGASVDVGVLRPKRVCLYRVRLSVPEGACASRDRSRSARPLSRRRRSWGRRPAKRA